MSATQREQAEKLRAKYARTFAVPLDTVAVEHEESEDARVSAPGLPVWTLGTQPAEAPAWATNHKVKTW